MSWLSECTPWSMQGKMGLHWGHHGGSLYFTWQENHDFYDISLNGPLGEGSVHMHGDAQGVTLQDNEGRVQHADTPEAMLHATLGINAPLSQLRQWIHGQAASPDARVILDSTGRLIRLQDGHFTIQYFDYNPVGAYFLPGRVKVTSPQFSLIMAIHQWSVSESCHPIAY